MPATNDDIDILYIGILFGHGGDAVQMLDLAAGMAARGVRVKIVVPRVDTTEGFEQRCRERGIAVERSPLVHVHATHTRQSVVNMVRLLRANPCALLHLHTGDVCPPRRVLLALRLLEGTPAMVTVHSPYDNIQSDGRRARNWRAFADERLHAVVCPSENSRRIQLGYGLSPDRVRVIYNCVDNERIAAGTAESARRRLAEIGVRPDRRLVVFTSRLELQKRPRYAIRAFCNICRDLPDVDLVMVGQGSVEPAARAMAQDLGIADRVHFVGHQDNVPDWLAASDVWLLPTDAENFSIAVLEALAAGCAIVTTHCAGNDEVLVHDQNALLAHVGDVPAMSAALRRLLTDEPTRQRLKRMARATAEDYTYEKMIDQYACCYNEALGIVTKAARLALPDLATG